MRSCVCVWFLGRGTLSPKTPYFSHTLFSISVSRLCFSRFLSLCSARVCVCVCGRTTIRLHKQSVHVLGCGRDRPTPSCARRGAAPQQPVTPCGL